jgi:hypothetical protein
VTGAVVENAHASSERQEMLVRRCKGLEVPGGPGTRLAIHDDEGRVVGAMRSIDLNMVNDSEIVEQMTRWRAKNAANFFTQFSPTVERTRRWLNDDVLHEPTRLLFMVEGEDGQRLGQFGLCGITDEAAQLDNGIRGESGGHPRLFYFAELSAIQFCFEYLGVGRIFGHMFSNNTMALLLHKAVGLTIEKVQPLRRTESLGEVRFDPASTPNLVNTKLQLLTLSVDRKSFYLRHPKSSGHTFLGTQP